MHHALPKGTKGTITTYCRAHRIWAKYPATVLSYTPGTANTRPKLLVQHDGVAPDYRTFTSNVLGQTRVFTLSRKRRWVNDGHWLNRDEQPGRMHFVPGPQAFMDPPF